MPEPLVRRPTAQKPGAVNDLCPPLLDRLQQFEIILRVEFEVGILDEDDPASRLAESSAHRGPLAAILRLKEDPDVIRAEPITGRRKNHSIAPAALLIQLAEKLSRPVGRAIVYDHDLLLDLHGLHSLQDLLNGRPLVVDRHDDRELRRSAYWPMATRRRRAALPRFVLDQHIHKPKSR